MNSTDEYTPVDRSQFRVGNHSRLQWYLAIPSYVVCILLIILFIYIKKAAVIIEDDLKSTAVHDTVYLKPANIYNCWNCCGELHNILKGPVECCGLEYTLVNNELVAKKLP